MMIWGPPGIGKSDVARKFAKQAGISLIDKRLSQSDPTELKGYPWPDQKAKVMTFFRDGELPTGGEGVLFLDEINNAPQAVQAPAYQLILDRRLGSYELPPGWTVLAAGNRAQDRSITHAMSAALANRFIHVDMEADPDEWQKWARENGIGDATRGYLRFRPGNLMVDKIEAGVRGFASPRSWATADKIMHDTSLDPKVKTAMLIGTVGEGVAIEYEGFAREEANLPNLDLVLINPEKVAVPKSPSTLYAVVARLESFTTPGNITKVLQYASRLPKEFETVFMHSCAQNDELMETQAMNDWIIANHELLV